jgi:hypothetical protein
MWRERASQDKVPEIFYPKLYELQPTTKPLFAHTSIPKQGAKLTKMLTKAVDGLSDLDQLVPKLEALGRRHAAYGVTDGARLHCSGTMHPHTWRVGMGWNWRRMEDDSTVSLRPGCGKRSQNELGQELNMVWRWE